MNGDLTDEELEREERRAVYDTVARLVAEVKRRRAHKCERGGKCGECGAPTIPSRFCHECSQ